MFLDLTKLERGRLEERFGIGPDHAILESFQAEVREPLILEVELVNPSSRTYVLTAKLRGTVFAPCRRCLTPVGIPVDDRFRVVYQEPSRGAEPDEESGGGEIVWIEAGARKIDIGPVVRDRLFLDTEMYPLCREDCQGFCPVCGTNRNEEECDCVVETVDTRWKALEKLREGEEFE